MKHVSRQSGVASVITVLLLAIVVMLVLVMSIQISVTGVNDTLNQSDSVAALFLAESGVERASWNFGNSGVCDTAMAEGPVSMGSGSFTIEDLGAGFNTDFSGAALPAEQCRVRVTGTVSGSNTSRTTEAVLEINANLIQTANPDFNDPPGSGPPTGWTFNQSGAFSGDPWDDTGGPDGSRAAFIYKPNPGGGAANGGGSFALSGFTVTAPITLSMTFDYKVENGSAPNSMQLTFSVSDGSTIYSSAVYQDSNTGGAFVSGTTTIDLTGSGSVSLTALSFDLEAKSGQPNRIWLDNLVLTGGGGGAGGPVTLKQWREVVY
ncbi:MAG: hypothetical protein LJE85_16130 [Gammaproteobacteria bacterium]|jgi:Tfp pilus assembly protein PilX|nr:hypothetical protein [Gammaproteobacteria bacterium]